jgi:hypothetical protein
MRAELTDIYGPIVAPSPRGAPPAAIQAAAPGPSADAVRASDADRDKALGLLRDHWLAGRLTLEEYEARCGEAAAGRFLDELRGALRELPYPLPEHAAVAASAPPPAPAPDPRGGAVLALVLGVLSLLGVLLSFGMLFILTLPASTWGWSLGRRARRAGAGGVRVVATIGEALAVLATVIGCLALAACATFVAAA